MVKAKASGRFDSVDLLNNIFFVCHSQLDLNFGKGLNPYCFCCTLLYFSQKLLHVKKIKQLTFYLPNFS